MLLEHVRSTVMKLDQRHAECLTLDPPTTNDDLTDRRSDADYALSILLNPSDPRGDERVSRLGERLLTETGVDLGDPAAEAKFNELLRRALIELERRRLDRYDNRYDRDFYDSMFDSKRATVVSFGELASLYIDERSKEYSLNRVSNKRMDMLIAHVTTICEIIGDDTPVHTIDDDATQAARGLLAQMPTNRSKRYASFSIREAIERAQMDQRATMAPATQSKYLDVLRDILKVAVRKKLLSYNPAAEVRPLVKDTIAGEDKRHPWTEEQLAGFFQGQFYRSCAVGAKAPYAKPDRAWRFWIPLIMLFSGARPGEICRLCICDVKQTSNGVWYFDLTNEGGKTLKTASSRRELAWEI